MKRYRIRPGSIAWWAINAAKAVFAVALIYITVCMGAVL